MKNLKNLVVHIAYKNKNQETVSVVEYPLEEFVDIMKSDMHRMITDVESLIYRMTQLPREEWPDDIWEAYIYIKHKLLDKAGDISRLPENLSLKE